MSRARPMRKVAMTSTGPTQNQASQRVGVAPAVSALNIARKLPTAGSPSAEALAAGLGATPAHNLRFRGGRTIQHLTYVNLFIGGSAAWSSSDIQNVDRALAAIMTDSRLDIVVNQYFPNGPASTT